MLAVVLLALPGTARAQASELDAWLASVESQRADFSQTLYDENNEPLEESTGVVYLARPGRFRWDYDPPYEQSIVSDGERLWMYEPELAQVTVRRLGDAIGNTPAELLATHRPVEESFRVTDLGELAGAVRWFELEPLTADATFKAVRLGFRRGDLVRMELLDGFGQTTELRFEAVSRNPILDPELFHFEPPPGTDVINLHD